MSMTCSVRVEHKSKNAAGGQRRHDTREGSRIPDYVDQDRISENSIIIKPAAELELKKMCLERRAQVHHERSAKADLTIASVGIITFGTEAQKHIEALPRAEQDRLYEKAARRVAEELGTTLTGLVVHRDESAPHAHFQMPAYALDGRPVSKHMDRALCKSLQDVVGEVYNELGITRGKPRAERIRDAEPMANYVHRSVRELHNDLPKEIEAQKEKVRKNEHRLERLQEKVNTGKADMEKVSKTMETYIRRAQEAKAEVDRLEKIGAGVPMPWTEPRPKLMAERTEVVTGREMLIFKKTEKVDMVPVEKVTKMIEAYDSRETSQRVIIGRGIEVAQGLKRELDLSTVKIRELEKVKAYYATLELKAEKVLEKTTELHNADVDPIKSVRGQTKLESLIELSGMRKTKIDGISLSYNSNRIIWDGLPTREGHEKLPAAMVELKSRVAKHQQWSGLVLESGDKAIREAFREKFSDVKIMSEGRDHTRGELPELPEPHRFSFDLERTREWER